MPGNVAASGIPVSSTAPYLIEPTSILINSVTKYGDSRQEICDSRRPVRVPRRVVTATNWCHNPFQQADTPSRKPKSAICGRRYADPSGRGYVRDLQAEFHSRRGRVGRDGVVLAVAHGADAAQ